MFNDRWKLCHIRWQLVVYFVPYCPGSVLQLRRRLPTRYNIMCIDLKKGQGTSDG